VSNSNLYPGVKWSELGGMLMFVPNLGGNE
jgi:hypothetical protein